MINIVLVEPEIPQNTGNIARTCAATGSKLHLVKPFGFNITDSQLKRAGLDYWNDVDIYYYDSILHFMEEHSKDKLFFSLCKPFSLATTELLFSILFLFSLSSNKSNFSSW